MISNKELGNRIRQIRKIEGISTKDFIEKINNEISIKEKSCRCHLSKQMLYNIEKGNTIIPAIILIACSKVLNVDIEYFYKENDENIKKICNSILFMKIKLNNLTKILEKLSDDKVYKKVLKILDKLDNEISNDS